MNKNFEIGDTVFYLVEDTEKQSLKHVCGIVEATTEYLVALNGKWVGKGRLVTDEASVLDRVEEFMYDHK